MARKGLPGLARMSARQLEAYERSLHALSLMRRLEMPLTAAAREAGTTPETVRRLAGPALVRVRDRWSARPRDRLERRVLLYDPKGSFHVMVGSSAAATRIAEYHNAVRWYLETGDPSRLKPFAGKYVTDVEGKRHPFLTDPDAIRRLARAGSFGFESIY